VAKGQLRLQVPDPELRRKLTPNYRLGCKRILVSDAYYPALRQPNVEVVTSGIGEVRQHSIVDRDGHEREVDTIIFGTRFRVTDPPCASYVRGRDGVLLADAWSGGSSAYLGTAISGFPNAFTIVGPNTTLGHSSMIYIIESQTAYIAEALNSMRASGATAIEVRADVQARYNDELQHKLAGTVWNTGGCRSWYLDRNGRNTTLWPSFTFRFRQRTRSFDPADYLMTYSSAPRGTGAAEAVTA
jgi:cation diffusion facilitator CzcD-associated flavoprotein CzcO